MIFPTIVAVLCYLVIVLCFILATTKYNFSNKTLHIPHNGILFKVRTFMNFLPESLFHPLVGLSINWNDAQVKATHMTSLCALYWKLVFMMPFAIFVIGFLSIAMIGSGIFTAIIGLIGVVVSGVETIRRKTRIPKRDKPKKLNIKVYNAENLYKFLNQSRFRKIIKEKGDLVDKVEQYLASFIEHAKNPKKAKYIDGQAAFPYVIKRILDQVQSVKEDREWNIIFNYWCRINNLVDVSYNTKKSMREICLNEFLKIDKEFPIAQMCLRIKQEYDQRLSVRIRRKVGIVITTLHSNMCPVIIQEGK